MATLWIANPTLQHHTLHINLTPPVKRNESVPYQEIRIVHVPARGGAQFPDDLEPDTLKRVLKQIESAGGTDESNPKAITGRFSLIYKVGGKPIDSNKIDTAAVIDEEVRQQLGATEIEKAASAAFKRAEAVGATEVTMSLTQTTDAAPVKGGVNVDTTVTKKGHIPGGRAESRKG